MRYHSGVFSTAPAVAAPAVAVLVEQILWESRICFTKTFGKTASSGFVKWIRE
jgi:hypothetical protein